MNFEIEEAGSGSFCDEPVSVFRFEANVGFGGSAESRASKDSAIKAIYGPENGSARDDDLVGCCNSSKSTRVFPIHLPDWSF